MFRDGFAALTRYEQTGGEADFHAARDRFDQAAARAGRLETRLGALSNLALVWFARHRRTREGTAAEEAIRLLMTAAITAEGETGLDELKQFMLENLRLAVEARRATEDTDTLADADRLYAMCCDLMALTTLEPNGGGLQFVLLANITEPALQRRWQITQDDVDLLRLAELRDWVAELAPPGSSDERRYLRLSTACWSRLGSRHSARLIRAVETLLARTPETDPERAGDLALLGAGYVGAWQAGGRLADLDRGIDLLRSLSERDLPTAAFRAVGYALTNALLRRYEAVRDLDALDEAVTRGERCAAMADDRDAELPELLDTLAQCLYNRYQNSGAPADLDRGMTYIRRVLGLLPQEAPQRQAARLRRATYEMTLAELHGDTALLAEAAAAIAAIPIEQATGWELVVLGNAAMVQFGATRDERFETRAQAAFELALAPALDPATSSDAATNTSVAATANLVGLLMRRYERRHARGDLSRATILCEDTLAVTPRGWHVWPAVAVNLARCWRMRYEATGSMVDLREAVDVLRSAVAVIDPHSIWRPDALAELGLALRVLYGHTTDEADLRQACDALREAAIGLAAQADAAGRDVFSAWGWTAAALGDWHQAAGAYAQAVEVGARRVRSQVGRGYAEPEAREQAGTVREAAYAAARTGALTTALSLLERARVQLLRQVHEQDLDLLRRLDECGHPDLRRAYEQAVNEVDAGQRWDITAEPGAAGGPTPTQRRAWQRLDQIAEQIRAVPGLADFLAPVDEVPVSSGSALVYLCATRYGGFAIIAEANPRVIWLDALNSEAVQRLEARFITAQYGPPSVTTWLYDSVDEVTRALWQLAMGPLLAALGTADAGGTGLCLVPMGGLAVLPLHAAWTEDADAPSGRRFALDDVLITYAPSGRALVEAQSNAAATTATATLLAVADPRPITGMAPLPGAQAEVAAATRYFDEARTLVAEQATRAAVLHGLTRHSVAHLAVHGRANLRAPLDSSFVLAHDERISLRDLLALRLTGVRLAVLSSCMSSVQGYELPDEAISLPTGLLHAGASGVIGTLWSVSDDSAQLLIGRFYQLWRSGGLSPAEALRRAQQWLRDSRNGDLPTPDAVAELSPAARQFWSESSTHVHPAHWAAFTYTGA